MSTLGGWIIRFLFGWVAWDLTASAFWVGSVAGLMLVPTFLLSPLFGIAADRMNPRNGILVTIGLQALLAALTGGIAWADALSMPALLVLALSFGAVSAAHTPIRLALIPRLVDRAALPSAIGYSAIIFNTSRIIGPAVGAWILNVGSVASAFFLSAVICLAAQAMLVRVDGSARPLSTAHRGTFSEQLRAGLQYVRGESTIRIIFLLTLTSGLLGRTAIELLPAISGRVLNGDAGTLAILTAGAGVGSILGGLIVSRQSSSLPRLRRLVMIGVGCCALILMSVLYWRFIAAGVLAIALVSLCTTMVGTGCQAITQLMVEEDYRGRVMSLWTVIAMGTPALGAMLIGATADRFGFEVALPLSSVFALAVVAWVYSYLRRTPSPLRP